MKKFRNILAMLMVFVMLVAVMPTNVFAGTPTETGKGENPPVVTPGAETDDGEGDGKGAETGDKEEDPLKDAKETAKKTVNDLKNISDTDRAAAIKAIDAATKQDEIDAAVKTAKDADKKAEEEKKKAEEEEALKKEKEKAVAELDDLTHLSKEEKEEATKAINDAKTTEEVTTALNNAKAKEEEKKGHEIKINDSKNGKVEADKKTAKKGEEITLTITPEKGYKLKELKVMAGDKEVKVKENNKFSMPVADVEVSAEFEKKTEEKPDTKPGYYKVGVYSYAHGSAEVNTSLAKEGEKVTVTAKPNYGYVVSKVSVYNRATKETRVLRSNPYKYYYGNGYYRRYNDYNKYLNKYENNSYYLRKYDSYREFLRYEYPSHYRYYEDYDYWTDRYDYDWYNRYDNYYYRYLDDYDRNYSNRYDNYEEYLYYKHRDHYRDYYDYRYDFGYYNYSRYNFNTSDEFTMPASDVTVYVEFTDWSYYGYYYDDYYYYRYHRDKKDKVKEEKEEEEKKPVEEKTPQVYEASATINVGSNVFTKVNKNVTTTHQMDVAAYVKNGRVMLPLRYVAEALGLQVSWVPETKTVVIWDLTQRVEIPIKSNKMIVNGVTYTSDVKPEINNSRTMLPIANVARALGLIDGTDIIWDPVMKQVNLTRRVLSK